MKKKWLWLLLIPAGIVLVVVGVPAVLIGMMIGTRMLSIIAGPVNIWNITWHLPRVADFTGYYKLSERGRRDSKALGAVVSKDSGFKLYADHRMEIIDLPDFSASGEPNYCSYNGTGDWSLYEGGGISLNLDIKVRTPALPGNRPSCGPASLSLFEVLGHSPPYRLWYNVGDPDEERGLTYLRQTP
jgi:hypothetical protein